MYNIIIKREDGAYVFGSKIQKKNYNINSIVMNSIILGTEEEIRENEKTRKNYNEIFKGLKEYHSNK